MIETALPKPDLSDRRVMRAVSGLRPCRHGGLRIEAERFGSTTIIHNYGQGGCGVTIGFGCAVIAGELVRKQVEPGAHVGVLGGGVTGLTTARELIEAGYSVTLYAKRWDTATTSNLAGALWLPTGIETGNSPESIEQLDRVVALAHERFAQLDRTRFGVQRLPVFEPSYTKFHPEYFRAGTIEAPMEIGRLPLEGLDYSGRVFHTDFVHTPRFLRTLRVDLEALGARFVTTQLDDLDSIRALPQEVLVNCLALSSRDLFGDTAVFPAYGVLVHVEPVPLGYVIHDGYKYLFPREDALVLGGCFIPDRWDTEPDPTIVSDILNHHRQFFNPPSHHHPRRTTAPGDG